MRRRQRQPNLSVYSAALYRIGQLEANTVRAMCPIGDIKPDDFLEWLIEPDALAKLRAAWPVVAHKGSSDYTLNYRFACGEVCFNIEYGKLKCLVPNHRFVKPQGLNERMIAYVNSIGAIVNQCNKLRSIVAHFSSNRVTPGAAKYYFPTLQPLLPEDHPFHKATGNRHRLFAFPYEITECLREAPEIIAKGILCGGIKPVSKGNSPVQVQIGNGQYLSLYPEWTA